MPRPRNRWPLPDPRKSQDELIKKIASWQKLAASNQLLFSSANFFWEEPQVTGTYRGHQLILYMKGQKEGTRETRIILSTNHSSQERVPVKPKKPLTGLLTRKGALRLLLPNGLTYRLRGQIKADLDGQKIYYRQLGLEGDLKYLQFLLNLLSNLAHAYPKALAIGGEIVPALRELIFAGEDHILKPVAIQLLEDIAWETKERLKHQEANLLCPNCLVYLGAHRIRLSWWKAITYYGCRNCGQSREFLENRAIVVLDSQMANKQIEQNEVLRVNWLSRRTLFDFDEVHIIRATDKEVEAFAIQVGNDTDEVRQLRYKQMPCTVSSNCNLTENTKRILRQVFCRIEMAEEDIRYI